MALGLDPSSSLSNDDLGIFIGGINLLGKARSFPFHVASPVASHIYQVLTLHLQFTDIPLGVSTQTLPSWPPYDISGEVTLKIAILDIEGELGAVGIEIWNASVSIGAVTSKTYVEATPVANFFP
jgi:hypothetical protein